MQLSCACRRKALLKDNQIWAEFDLTVLIKETGTIVFPIDSPNFSSPEAFIEKAKEELASQIMRFMAKPETTTLSSMSYQEKLVRFYPDTEGDPNFNFPIELNELEDLIRLDHESN
jgi:hypothetical protein